MNRIKRLSGKVLASKSIWTCLLVSIEEEVGMSGVAEEGNPDTVKQACLLGTKGRAESS